MSAAFDQNATRDGLGDDFERRFIACLMSDPDQYAAVREIVTPADIEDLRARFLFEVLDELRDQLRAQDGSIDTVLLARHLGSRGELASVGGPAGLAEIQDLEAVAAYAPRYAREVRRASIHREIRRHARAIALAGDDRESFAMLANCFQHLKDAGFRQEQPLSTRVLSGIEAAAVNWVWRGRIPSGKLTTFDGDPGVGKSTILADLVARVTTGSPMPDGSPGILGNVVILCAEDDADDTIRPRMEAAGADLSRVHIVVIDDSLPSVVDQADALIATLKKHDARLLVVDPFATFMGSKTKSGETNSTSNAMFKIKRAAREADCAVILVRHLNKDAKQGKAIYRGTNSISIIGTVRAGLIAGTDPEDPTRCVLAVSKANLASKDDTHSIGYRITTAAGPAGPTSRVEWLGEVDWHPDEVVGVVNPGRETARESAVDWLRQILAAGPMLATEVEVEAKTVKFSWRTIKRAKDEAGVVSKQRFDRRWEWKLADGVQK